MGKAKRSNLKTKTVPSSKERLHMLHMDLCGPMRVEIINGKKYILVIVDDYSIYTWTCFLRSKDETPENKKDEDNTVIRNKSRLVAKGYHQEEGINFEESFAPMDVKMTVRIKSLLDAVRITATHVYVNVAQLDLVLLMNFKENMLNMDQDSAHMVAASKVPMLKPKGVMREMPITTTEEKAQRRLEVKARRTLMIGIPNEHHLKFNSIKDAKKLLEAVKKRFGGNAATRKTQRNLLKQQYEKITLLKAQIWLDQTFDRLQKLVEPLDF
ncbi:ribonuclease H-like domain-containing protein [Tanacetum coccineum]|uniref:Ribonuclease H-like domain-containing protein n=1 Tax=Tanacetum coccineum TaxID=301880 RepID=A0ABQ4YNU7_9ASTR